MAKNDAILIDGIIQEKMTVDLLDRGEAFELFAFEQILKSYDLTREEIESGWVDGKDDGGIDGFYTFINGVLLRNIQEHVWPRKNASLDIWVISCKLQDSFKQAPLNTLFPTIEELLDFSKNPSDFVGQYSEALIKARQIAVQAFLRTASGLPSLNFYFGYASRGDLTELGENIEARGNQLKRIVRDYFSAATISLEYFGATELIALHRKTRVILELPFVEELSREQSAFVLLVPIDTYARFVSDEYGQLRRYLFDSNVRDFLGQNRVNQDITDSLFDDKAPDFWWLNNGVTVLATSAVPLGKTPSGNAIQLHDVQIVNGLQTTQSIYNYFKVEGAQAKGRCVMIKVIISEDETIRDAIIQATNNQSQVELSALNATDKIQRDIEEILERHQWYYERRKNYYKNIGKPAERFITPLLLAVSLIAIVKKAPDKAGILKTKFMRNPASYEAVFSDKLPIELWPKLAGIMKAVEAGMIVAMPRLNATENRILGRWRGAVALCAMAKLIGEFNFDTQAILDTNIDSLTPELIEYVFSSLRKVSSSRHSFDRTNRETLNRFADMDMICHTFGEQEGIGGCDNVGKWMLPTGTAHNHKRILPIEKQAPNRNNISDEIIALVEAKLPKQPWPPGIQKQICEDLGIDKKIVHQAVIMLIKSGTFLNQYTGVVVDSDGYIVAVDYARAEARHKVGEKYQFQLD